MLDGKCYACGHQMSSVNEETGRGWCANCERPSYDDNPWEAPCIYPEGIADGCENCPCHPC